MTVHLFKGEDAKVAADIALKHKLYISGWSLSGELKSIRKGAEKAIVAIAYSEDKPVGVCIQKDNGMTQVFVRKSERNKGHGRKLVRQLKHKSAWAMPGISDNIWVCNGVSVK